MMDESSLLQALGGPKWSIALRSSPISAARSAELNATLIHIKVKGLLIRPISHITPTLDSAV